MDFETRLPQVFGHRGASAYRPENTLEAFALAFEMGADAIECDLVPTKDGRLILRHESELSGTTDVAAHPEFASRHRTEIFYGRWNVDGWFSEDFTLDEISTLRATERIPEQRPGSAKFDGQFAIPTIDDLLAQPLVEGKSLILEIKHGGHYASKGFDMVGLLKDAVDRSPFAHHPEALVYEAFHWETIVDLKQRIGGESKFVFLVEWWGMPATTDEIPAWMDNVAANVDGISFDVKLLQENPSLVEMAHARGLSVFTWTARAEDAETSVEEYYHRFVSLGTDGVFADHPDLFRAFVDGLA
jgi:glycerophosphoryl diester phosphodiesterase